MVKLFDERAGRYATLPDVPTENLREAEEMRKDQRVEDMAYAIYQDDALYMESIDSALCGEICDDEWRKKWGVELIRMRDGRKANDLHVMSEACVGMDDLATEACYLYAEMLETLRTKAHDV